eukprot:6896007-Prorocentrum_lima.AAC.1
MAHDERGAYQTCLCRIARKLNRAQRRLRRAKLLYQQARQVAKGYRQAAQQLRERTAWTVPVIQFFEASEGTNREVTTSIKEYI